MIYYQDDWVTLYHGCSLNAAHAYGLLITDPPYGMSFVSNHRKTKHRAIKGDDALPIERLAGLINNAEHAAYIFCRWDNIREMPKPKSVLAWVKNNHSMGDLKHQHGRKWEACLFYPGPRHEFVTRTPDVIFADRTGNDWHPTQKPVDLMRQLIDANIGDVVFDPYAGSGSTLVAAKQAGRRAIGYEIDERYCKVAAQRLMQCAPDKPKLREVGLFD